MMKKILVGFFSLLLFLQGYGQVAAAETVFQSKQEEKTTKVSPGVTYSNQKFANESLRESVHVLEINMNDPFTKLELAWPQSLGETMKTSQMALMNNREGNRVVGAVNASFFNTSQKLPVNLIARNNELLHPGTFGLTTNSPTNAQVAFGIDQHGEPKLTNYQLTANVSVGGQTFAFKDFNQVRGEQQAVVYMAPSTNTGANAWGTEIVIERNVDGPVLLGNAMSGTVSKITRIGEGGGASVPKNGFVISAHGKEWADRLATIKEGDPIDLSVDIDPVWQDAQYMIAAGPSLVLDGQINISMNEANAFAKYRNPRTAVGVNKSGDKVFLVTIDGRQSNSIGVSIRDLAEYMKSLGAYQALNLDGGGSSTMVIRKLGETEPSLINQPSDGVERSVLTSLQAISTAPTGKIDNMVFAMPKGKIITGTNIDVAFQYALDQYLNPIHVNEADIQFEVTNGLGRFTKNSLRTEKAGNGAIIATYQGVKTELPIEVVDTFAQLQTSVQSLVLGKNDQVQLQASPTDETGSQLIYDPALLKWEVKGDIGAIKPDGTFTTTDKTGEGIIVATLRNVSVEIPVKVTNEPVLIDSFDRLGNWQASAARAKADVQLASQVEPFRQGSSALKLNYDFTTAEAGTKAAYVESKAPITLPGKPKTLGLWVYGDGGNHWLRSKLTDRRGISYTIDFTKDGGFNWTGWNYVSAAIPTEATLPIKLEQIYVAEINQAKQNKGTIYFDQLQAVYAADYQEPVFKDLLPGFWAYVGIETLKENQVINGFNDGTFRPNQGITRAEAALMITRQLGLNSDKEAKVKFDDVADNHFAKGAISAVSAAGIMTGQTNAKFAPNQPLTRAEMATILQRAYQLKGSTKTNFTDIEDHWAKAAIETLAANNLAGGYEDETFRPNKTTTRAEFSAFVTRAINKK